MDQHLIKSLLALMKKIEWSGQGREYSIGEYQEICPVCHQPPPRPDLPDHAPDHAWYGHYKECELLAVIDALNVTINLEEKL